LGRTVTSWQLQAILKRLPKTADAIAQLLRERDCKGRPGDPLGCPITDWLRRELGWDPTDPPAKLAVGSHEATVVSTCGGKLTALATMPDQAGHFVELFDELRFADLVADCGFADLTSDLTSDLVVEPTPSSDTRFNTHVVAHVVDIPERSV